MTVINTNIKSLVSQNALNRNSRDLSKAMEQLSTGSRINSAADDAAGLAISNKMTAQIRGLNQAVRNANDGISLIQTVEGATKEITNMLQRMRELSVQAANDTYTSGDRAALVTETDELSKEISRIASNTTWNGLKLLDGSQFTSASAASFMVGANSADATITVSFQSLKASALSVSALTLTTASGAKTALGTVDAALKTIDTFRATLGAKINRLTYAADNLTNISQNTSASRSRILDTDFAKASSELSRTQIIQQAATAVLAQANTDQQSVLKLLQ
jgi:flagellin